MKLSGLLSILGVSTSKESTVKPGKSADSSGFKELLRGLLKKPKPTASATTIQTKPQTTASVVSAVQRGSKSIVKAKTSVPQADAAKHTVTKVDDEEPSGKTQAEVASVVSNPDLVKPASFKPNVTNPGLPQKGVLTKAFIKEEAHSTESGLERAQADTKARKRPTILVASENAKFGTVAATDTPSASRSKNSVKIPASTGFQKTVVIPPATEAAADKKPSTILTEFFSKANTSGKSNSLSENDGTVTRSKKSLTAPAPVNIPKSTAPSRAAKPSEALVDLTVRSKESIARTIPVNKPLRKTEDSTGITAMHSGNSPSSRKLPANAISLDTESPKAAASEVDKPRTSAQLNVNAQSFARKPAADKTPAGQIATGTAASLKDLTPVQAKTAASLKDLTPTQAKTAQATDNERQPVNTQHRLAKPAASSVEVKIAAAPATGHTQDVALGGVSREAQAVTQVNRATRRAPRTEIIDTDVVSSSRQPTATKDAGNASSRTIHSVPESVAARSDAVNSSRHIVAEPDTFQRQSEAGPANPEQVKPIQGKQNSPRSAPGVIRGEQAATSLTQSKPLAEGDSKVVAERPAILSTTAGKPSVVRSGSTIRERIASVWSQHIRPAARKVVRAFSGNGEITAVRTEHAARAAKPEKPTKSVKTYAQSPTSSSDGTEQVKSSNIVSDGPAHSGSTKSEGKPALEVKPSQANSGQAALPVKEIGTRRHASKPIVEAVATGTTRLSGEAVIPATTKSVDATVLKSKIGGSSAEEHGAAAEVASVPKKTEPRIVSHDAATLKSETGNLESVSRQQVAAGRQSHPSMLSTHREVAAELAEHPDATVNEPLKSTKHEVSGVTEKSRQIDTRPLRTLWGVVFGRKLTATDKTAEQARVREAVPQHPEGKRASATANSSKIIVSKNESRQSTGNVETTTHKPDSSARLSHPPAAAQRIETASKSDQVIRNASAAPKPDTPQVDQPVARTQTFESQHSQVMPQVNRKTAQTPDVTEPAQKQNSNHLSSEQQQPIVQSSKQPTAEKQPQVGKQEFLPLQSPPEAPRIAEQKPETAPTVGKSDTNSADIFRQSEAARFARGVNPEPVLQTPRESSARPAPSVTTAARSVNQASHDSPAQQEQFHREDQQGPGNNSPNEIRQATQAQRTDAPNFAPRLTADQIRDLQALVQKALESSRAAISKGSEAVFDWKHKDLGTLRFTISTSDSDVRVKIQSDRADVADTIDKSRAVVERMITDQGLRVERFEVQFRTPADAQARPDQFAQRQASNHDQPSQQSGGSSREHGQSDSKSDSEPPRRRPLGGDREWVA